MRTLVPTASLVCALVPSLALGPTMAHAHSPRASLAFAAQPSEDDIAKGKALYQEGYKFFRLGDYKAAIPKFEEAYALTGLPALLKNIGLAYLKNYDLSQDLGELNDLSEDLPEVTAALDNELTGFLTEINAETGFADRDHPYDRLIKRLGGDAGKTMLRPDYVSPFSGE